MVLVLRHLIKYPNWSIKIVQNIFLGFLLNYFLLTIFLKTKLTSIIFISILLTNRFHSKFFCASKFRPFANPRAIIWFFFFFVFYITGSSLEIPRYFIRTLYFCTIYMRYRFRSPKRGQKEHWTLQQ